ncbi:Pr6Pr family membrane protein [Ruminococcaceae bacterium OttesenSCG-928-A11]|nr:Pr6Pr family membrane protein [Ruminococcaceae bacterium OttesenSCG-928-A11]
MAVKNRRASLIYKLVLIVVCLVGLLMNSGLLSRGFSVYRLFYYTLASNLLCLVYYIISAIVTTVELKKNGPAGLVRFTPHFKGAIVMAMLLTGVAYFTLLAEAPLSSSSAFSLTANIIVHFLVPLMVLVDWALFDRKGQFAGADPIIWAVVPLIYYGGVLVAAGLGMKYYGGTAYPYAFLDPYRTGWGPALRNVVLIAALYLVAGYLLFAVDRFLGYCARKNQEEAQAQANGRSVYKAGSTAVNAPAAPVGTAAGQPSTFAAQPPLGQPASSASPTPATASAPAQAPVPATVASSAQPTAPQQ